MSDELKISQAQVGVLLKKIGTKLAVVDATVVGLIKRRIDLAREVEYTKSRSEEYQPIFRPEPEDDRIAAIDGLAKSSGVNHHFARAIEIMLINESCKEQMKQREGQFAYLHGHELSAELYRQNLLFLTEKVSDTFDESYDVDFPATHAYLQFERSILDSLLDDLDDGEKLLALDLGSGTGNIAICLAQHFEQVMSFDVSDAMIRRARKKSNRKGISNIEFRVADVEDVATWQDIADASVDFIAMSFGTASDVSNIATVISQTRRVLKSGGKYLFSFYNREALLYAVGFIPWQPSLAAITDLERDCIDVHLRYPEVPTPTGKDLETKQIVSIFAKAYTLEEIEKLFSGKVSINQSYSYPTLMPLLSKELLQNPGAYDEVRSQDLLTSHGDKGAYRIVVGRKQ